jgi:hypothetical protein
MLDTLSTPMFNTSRHTNACLRDAYTYYAKCAYLVPVRQEYSRLHVRAAGTRVTNEYLKVGSSAIIITAGS